MNVNPTIEETQMFRAPDTNGAGDKDSDVEVDSEDESTKTSNDRKSLLAMVRSRSVLVTLHIINTSSNTKKNRYKNFTVQHKVQTPQNEKLNSNPVIELFVWRVSYVTYKVWSFP
jgi:hypothetical protein